MKTPHYLLIAVAFAVISYWLYAASRPVVYSDSAPVLGPIVMRVTIGNNSSLKTSPEEAVSQAFEAVRKINNAMTVYQEDSEISRLNRLSIGEELALSTETWLVMQEAMRYHRLSAGAFDITVGPLIELYQPLQNKPSEAGIKLPTPEEIKSARARIGSQYLSFSKAGQSVRVRREGMRIDLGAIAKGFAVDVAVQQLLRLGVKNCLVEIGGDLRVVGEHPEGRPWREAIQNPQTPQDPQNQLMILEETDCAIATSGNYQQFFDYEGKRYSHIIDPRSGYPVTTSLVGVTVIAPTCLQADAIATTISVLGEAEAAGFLAPFEDQGVKAILQVERQGGEIELIPLPRQ